MNDKLGKEFRKYATKHMGINGTTVDDVIDHQANGIYVGNSLTPMVLEERELRVTSLSVFDRLMMERIIWVAGTVDDRMSTVVQAQLMFLDSVDNKRDITMHCDTGGGSVKSGLSMVDVMHYINSDVATINTGLCASMGSILLSSGQPGKRSSLKYSKVMVHQVSSQTGGTVMDQRISLLEAEKYNFVLFKILAENCGKTFDEMISVANRDQWFNSDEALSFGLIDEIIGLDTTSSMTTMLDGFDDYYKKYVFDK